MWIFQIPLKSDLPSYPLKNIVKPNFIPSESQKSGDFTTKVLGFTQFLVDAARLEEVRFSMIFTVLVEFVQPNLRCHNTVFSKIDGYGLVMLRTRPEPISLT